MLLFLCEIAKMKTFLHNQEHVVLTWRKEWMSVISVFTTLLWSALSPIINTDIGQEYIPRKKFDFTMPHMFNLENLKRTVRVILAKFYTKYDSYKEK